MHGEVAPYTTVTNNGHTIIDNSGYIVGEHVFVKCGKTSAPAQVSMD